MTQRIHVVDSHTAGEPTRVIVAGGPELGSGTVAEQLARFKSDFDALRRAVVTEPRGHDVLVGAMLCPTQDPKCLTGVIFFNNVGFLGMCGHGLIGVVETLKHLGRITEGNHCIETPVGVVSVQANDDGSVTFENVESYRAATDVVVQIDGVGKIRGDVAWGGNWFFLAEYDQTPICLDNVGQLQQIASDVRRAVAAAGYPEVDHIELFGSSGVAGDRRNFVLCPGLEYDRSPCGTGTSAKLACLAADGKLQQGDSWVQRGVLGTEFRGRFEWADKQKQSIFPTIIGEAHVTAESQLILDENDPFRFGL